MKRGGENIAGWAIEKSRIAKSNRTPDNTFFWKCDCAAQS